MFQQKKEKIQTHTIIYLSVASDERKVTINDKKYNTDIRLHFVEQHVSMLQDSISCPLIENIFTRIVLAIEKIKR